MSSLAEFEKTLDALGQQADRLKGVTEIYTKVADMVAEYEHAQQQLEQGLLSMKQAQEDLIQQKKEVEASLQALNTLQTDQRKAVVLAEQNPQPI